ncbi:hypothetical protein BH20ACI4_BH20ACI4_16430 [soil metagenome]
MFIIWHNREDFHKKSSLLSIKLLLADLLDIKLEFTNPYKLSGLIT